jgi:hypothetical protein
MTDKATTLLKRFGRTFLFGGVAALLMALSTTPSLATLGDLRVWLTTLVMAFITGGLAAIDKAYRWQD